MLVLVGTESAAASINVMKEVIEFKKTGRPIIPITFLNGQDFSRSRRSYVPENLKGTLESATWHHEIAGIAKTYESKERLKAADENSALGPSPHVITRIVNAEDFVSRSRRLRKTFWTTLVSLLGVLTVTGVIALVLITKAYAQVATAKRDQAAADSARAGAQIKTTEAQAALVVAEGDLKTATDNLKIEKGKLEQAAKDLIAANEKTREEQTRAENAGREADRQSRIATSQQLAASAVSQTTSNPEASVMLAKDAYVSSPTDEAKRALRNSLLQSHVRNVIKKTRAHITDLDSTAQYAIVQGDDETISVQQIEDGKVLKTLHRPKKLGETPTFSPDGKYVVISGQDDRIYTALLWDWRAELSPKNPLMLSSGLPNEQGPCQCISFFCPIMATTFSSDGRYLAAASRRGMAWVWDTTTGERLGQLKVGETAINDLKFSPHNSRYIATGDNEGQVLYWDWKARPGETDRWAYRRAGSEGSVKTVAFSPSGYFLAASVNPKYPTCEPPQNSPPAINQAVVFQVPNYREVTLTGHVAFINDISFSPTHSSDDWPYLLTASSDGTARVYSMEGAFRTEKDKPFRTPVVLRHGKDVLWASFDPTGEYVVTSGMDRMSRVWKPGINPQWTTTEGQSVDSPAFITLRGHTESVSSRFSSKGYILTTSDDGTGRIWRNNANRVKFVIPSGNINEASFDPGGKHVLTTGASVLVWDAARESRAPQAELTDGTGQNLSAYWNAIVSADQRLVFAVRSRRKEGSVTTTRAVDYWEWQDATKRAQPHHFEVPGFLRSIAVSRHKDGPVYVATANGASDLYESDPREDKTLNAARIWKIEGSRPPSEVLVLPHPEPVMGIAFSHDSESRYLATATMKGVRIYDWSRSEKPIVLNTKNKFQEVVFSPNGRYVAALQMQGPIMIWDWQKESQRTNPSVLQSNYDGARWVRSFTFSPDSRLVLTGSGDGTLRLWDVATADELQIVGEFTSVSTKAMAFSPDGRYIVAPYGSTTRIYECPECMAEERLIEGIPERVSVETLRQATPKAPRPHAGSREVGSKGRRTNP
jgi:WD40 repeat protein